MGDYSSTDIPASSTSVSSSSQSSQCSSDGSKSSNANKTKEADTFVCDGNKAPSNSPSFGGMSPAVPECTVDASDIDLEDISEDQIDEKDLYITIIFSIFQDDDLKDKAGGFKEKNPKLFNNPHLLQNLSYGIGSFTKQEQELFMYNGNLEHDDNVKILYYDCSDLKVDGIAGLMSSEKGYEELLDKLDEVYDDLELYFQSKQTSKNKVHIVLAGFSPIEGLTVALADYFGYELDGIEELEGDTALYEQLKDYSYENYSDVIDYFVNEFGWVFELQYACIYESYNILLRRSLDRGAIQNLIRKNYKRYNIGDGNLYSNRELEEMMGRQLTPRELLKISEGKWDEVTLDYYSYDGLDYYTQAEIEDALHRDLTQEELVLLADGKWDKVAGLVKEDVNKTKKIVVTGLHVGLGVASIFFSPIALVDIGVEIYEMAAFGVEGWADAAGHLVSIGLNIVALIPVAGGVIKTLSNASKARKVGKILGETNDAKKFADVAEDANKLKQAANVAEDAGKIPMTKGLRKTITKNYPAKKAGTKSRKGMGNKQKKNKTKDKNRRKNKKEYKNSGSYPIVSRPMPIITYNPVSFKTYFDMAMVTLKGWGINGLDTVRYIKGKGLSNVVEEWEHAAIHQDVSKFGQVMYDVYLGAAIPANANTYYSITQNTVGFITEIIKDEQYVVSKK